MTHAQPTQKCNMLFRYDNPLNKEIFFGMNYRYNKTVYSLYPIFDSYRKYCRSSFIRLEFKEWQFQGARVALRALETISRDLPEDSV